MARVFDKGRLACGWDWVATQTDEGKMLVELHEDGELVAAATLPLRPGTHFHEPAVADAMAYFNKRLRFPYLRAVSDEQNGDEQ